MTFEEILDRTLDMLKRRGRVSYRALQRQFQLDDAYLDDLKAEIVEVLRLAVDQDNTMLVWTGDPSAPAPPSPPAHSTPPPGMQEALPAPLAAAPGIQPTPEAERRQLTVLFCDLVDSTRLAGQLDPEDWRDVVRAYQQTCAAVVQRFDGYVAQLLGDALLVYFGWPQAHEDDALRAVYTGLGMLAATGPLNSRLAHDKGLRLAIRVGIHTGLVVVGALGGAGRQEQLALGEVPNVASRIQGLAAPDTALLSAETARLVEGYFTVEDLGRQPLKGVAAPLQVYRVLRPSGAQSRLDVAGPRGLTPLVGREQDVGVLLERWHWAKAGQGQVVLLSGEPGIGKSRLVHVLKEHVTSELHTRLECRSSPHDQQSPLYPIIDLLQRLLHWQPNASPAEQLDTLTHALGRYRLPVQDAIPLLAPLLSLPLPADRYPPCRFRPSASDKRPSKSCSPCCWSRQRTGRSSLSWKMCIGPTPRPWSCWRCSSTRSRRCPSARS
jgi:class 3 adenylate cyclase